MSIISLFFPENSLFLLINLGIPMGKCHQLFPIYITNVLEGQFLYSEVIFQWGYPEFYPYCQYFMFILIKKVHLRFDKCFWMGIPCLFVWDTWGYYLFLGGDTWGYLGIPGDTWGYLGIPGDTWGYLFSITLSASQCLSISAFQWFSVSAFQQFSNANAKKY